MELTGCVGSFAVIGYRQGGMAGFGLRRMRVDQSGKPQDILAMGEHKSLQTDRVILVPGPDDEVETVRWMYRQFIDEGKVESEIAALLNERDVRTDLGRAWRVTSRSVFEPAGPAGASGQDSPSSVLTGWV